MRAIPLLSVLAALAAPALWVGARAVADEPPTPAPPAAAPETDRPVAPPAAPTAGTLEDALARIEALEARVAYLASREKALTVHALATEETATALASALRVARQEGFTAGAIAAPSREALLAGLEALARDLRRDLPVVSKDEARMLQALPRR